MDTRCLAIVTVACGLIFANTGCQSLKFPNPLAKKGNKPLGLRRDADVIDSDEYLDPLGRRSTSRILLEDLAPDQISTTLKARAAKKGDESAAREALAKGKELYDQALAAMDQNPDGEDHIELFTNAANQFRLAGARFPDSKLEEEALFFEGESCFFANRYVQSNRAFENLVVKYSGSAFLDKAEARRFAIAQYWLELADSELPIAVNDPTRPKFGLAGEARRILHRIRLDDPTGKLADDATLALGNAFFKAKRWVDAADAYEDLRMNYPGSPHQFHAHLFELKARVNAYRGASYDSEPLEKADKLLKQIVRAFPEQARQEEEYLGKEGALIRHKLAERDWSMGKYYERRGENRAALVYYQRVAQEYAETQYAGQASEKIAKLKDLPPVPKQHAEWLVKLLPEESTAKPLIATRPNADTIR